MSARKIIPLTTLTAALAMLAAGCGSGSPSHNDPQASKDPAQAAFAFAHCMRDHGVSGFPSPVVTSTGSQTTLKQMVPGNLVSSPAFKSAQKACASLAPGPQNGSSSTSHGPGKQVLLAFAQCLRAHGISGFPDPNAQGELTQEMITAAGVNIHAPGFFSVARGCLSVTHGAITQAQLAAAINGRH
jgi:hypothetical protein